MQMGEHKRVLRPARRELVHRSVLLPSAYSQVHGDGSFLVQVGYQGDGLCVDNTLEQGIQRAPEPVTASVPMSLGSVSRYHWPSPWGNPSTGARVSEDLNSLNALFQRGTSWL